MTRDELIALRKIISLNQTEMAEALGLKLRAYQDIEAGSSTLRKMHVLAAERIALSHMPLLLGSSEIYSTPWFRDLHSEAKAGADELD